MAQHESKTGNSRKLQGCDFEDFVMIYSYILQFRIITTKCQRSRPFEIQISRNLVYEFNSCGMLQINNTQVLLRSTQFLGHRICMVTI